MSGRLAAQGTSSRTVRQRDKETLVEFLEGASYGPYLAKAKNNDKDAKDFWVLLGRELRKITKNDKWTVEYAQNVWNKCKDALDEEEESESESEDEDDVDFVSRIRKLKDITDSYQTGYRLDSRIRESGKQVDKLTALVSLLLSKCERYEKDIAFLKKKTNNESVYVLSDSSSESNASQSPGNETTGDSASLQEHYLTSLEESSSSP